MVTGGGMAETELQRLRRWHKAQQDRIANWRKKQKEKGRKHISILLSVEATKKLDHVINGCKKNDITDFDRRCNLQNVKRTLEIALKELNKKKQHPLDFPVQATIDGNPVNVNRGSA